MALDKLVDSTQLNADLTTVANAIRTKGGTSAQLAFPNGMADAIAAIPSGGITPSGSVTLTSENTYDVTDKAQAVVDFSAVRANLAEAVTAKGVDTLPTASFDTIAVNIGLIEGGGGGTLPSVISKLDGGSFTPASDTLVGDYTVSHNLGEAPKCVAVFSDNEGGAYSVETVSSAFKDTNKQYEVLINVSTAGGNNVRGQTITAGSLTSTEWYLKRNNTYYKAGCTYNWLAWA